jgi:hypothetical protein
VAVDRDGLPVTITLGEHPYAVHLARRPWRIDQYWWRAEPVRRTYYRLVISPSGATDAGPPLTVYRDEVSGEWFRQEY